MKLKMNFIWRKLLAFLPPTVIQVVDELLVCSGSVDGGNVLGVREEVYEEGVESADVNDIYQLNVIHEVEDRIDAETVNSVGSANSEHGTRNQQDVESGILASDDACLLNMVP